MEKPKFNPETPTSPSSLQIFSPSSSGRRSSTSNSPDFEFWMVRNPSLPQPQLLSADELFVDGILLPLHLLRDHSLPPDPEEHKADPQPDTPNPETEPPEPETVPGPQSSAVLSTSKRWRDIFKIVEKRTTATTSSAGAEDREKDKHKERKKDRKIGGGGSGSGAELNINLWPFSRSRSAGNSGNRSKLAAAATRKVSSAPCSRSNSGGESKSRRWPSSPSRVGVHLGRSSPVWQVRRGGSGVRNADRTEPVVGVNVDKAGVARSSEPVTKTADKGKKKEAKETRRNKNNVGGAGARPRVLNLNVPMCIGYRHHLSCRSDENSTVGGGGGSGDQSSGAAGNSGSGASLLNLRTIFSKKVY